MTEVVFYFQVHQPLRLRRYSFFDIGHASDYFDDVENARILKRVAEKCYLPMNDVLLELIRRHDGRFRCAFSLSGVVLDQLERWAPEALASFQALVATGCVEILAETYFHSLAFERDPAEFAAQIARHTRRIEHLFGRRPTVFRNTELIASNAIAQHIEALGYEGLLAEGADKLLGWRSPHFVYQPEGCRKVKMLLRSYQLSDDIAFRFSNRDWCEWPLTADRFATWLHALPPEHPFVGLFIDYETFGEHQWTETGIFEFMRHLPGAVLAAPRFRFSTPSEVIAGHEPVGRLDFPATISWADTERDLTAWLGNNMQRAAHAALYDLGPAVRAAASAGRADLLESWRRLTTSDHLYYMCTKYFQDGDVHKYFSPYASPHDAFIAFMNVLADLTQRTTRARAEAERVALAPFSAFNTNDERTRATP
ncbi:MAG: glycoside hydrolase family 57 protein [Planctomycetota bacterium]